MQTLQPGQMLGPYQVINQIGKGGMATVYKAYHAAMDRYVALKVVAAGLTDDPNFHKRFQQEARLIAKLEHPHILPVHDFGEADGIPYMVMRFLEAGTLKDHLAAGPLSVSETDRIFSQLADALHYAHENGVIHRDIKPSNAMLDKRGDVFLTDFGVAKMLESSSGLTATGTVTGTPAYMSPEQAMGNKADPRSDVYSLGVMLFEMLTGRVPFEAETPMAVLFKQIQDPPPPLSIVRPDLPYTLEAVLLKALAKDPADRYATMQEFRAGWKNALSAASAEPTPLNLPPAKPKEATPQAAPLKTPATEPVKPAPQPRKSLPRWLWIGGVAFLLLLCCVGGITLSINLFGADENIQATPGSTAILDIPSPEVMAAAPAGDYTATSWAGGNSYHSLFVSGGQLLAGGPGGVTVFDLENIEKPTQYTTADGLPGAWVTHVHVNENNTLWVATDAGLLRVDGQDNQRQDIFTTDNGLDSDYVSVIASGGGQTYIGTQYSTMDGGGLLILDGETIQPVEGFPSQIEPDNEHVSSNVQDVLYGNAGGLWVATTDGIALLDIEGEWNVFKTDQGLPSTTVYSLYQDNQGDILAGTSAGDIVRFDWEEWAFDPFGSLAVEDLSVYEVYEILQDNLGNYWFAGYGIARYSPSEDTWEGFPELNEQIPLYSVLSMTTDGQGNIFFGTDENGLIVYSAGKFTNIETQNLPHFAYYKQIIASPQGALVFSELYDNGADVFDLASETWSRLPEEYEDPLAYDSDGNLWSGGYNGLWIFGPEKTTNVTIEHGLPSNLVRGLAFDASGLAYLATDEGIAVFDGLNVVETYTTENAGLETNDVTRLFVASDGSLWVANGLTISRRLPSGKWETYYAPDLFGGYPDTIHDFIEDGQGNLWLATHGDGLYRFSGGTWSRYMSTDPGVGLSSDYIASLTLGPDGALWIGTFGGGLVRFDGLEWRQFGMQDGLIHPTVFDIYITPEGTVWLATEGGITRLQP
jgi:serine/threonine protein kinase/ligand-binding sensor domain-containing protein